MHVYFVLLYINIIKAASCFQKIIVANKE